MRIAPLALLLSTSAVVAMAAEKPSLPAPLAGAGYELVFSEDFEGAAGAPADPRKWVDWTPGKRKDGWNVPECARLDGKGHLAIVTRRGVDEQGKVRWETGGVWTKGKVELTHGYFEVRCRQITQPGHWSAFWITSSTIGKPIGDPANAGVEIDVMEYLATVHKDESLHTLHWDGYAKEHKVAHVKRKIPGLGEGWHTYGVKWDESGYTFFTDGEQTGFIKEPVSMRPQYMLLTCEVGAWGGDIRKAKLPDTFLVDSVRVWQTPAQRKADARRATQPKPSGAPGA